MLTDEKNYEIHILKQAINHYLDKILSVNDENALNTLLYQCDDLVWKIATEIYSQSGHKVEFSLIRDLANSRIEPLKIRVAEQKAEQARLRAIEEEARQVEQARLKAITEEKRKVKEEAHRVEQARLRAIAEAHRVEEKQRKEREEARQAREKAYFFESGKDEKMFEVFIKMKEIISEQLEVELNDVTLDSDISKDLGADDLDAVELQMALEEEFEIEITKEIIDYYMENEGITVQKLLNFIYEQSSPQK